MLFCVKSLIVSFSVLSVALCGLTVHAQKISPDTNDTSKQSTIQSPFETAQNIFEQKEKFKAHGLKTKTDKQSKKPIKPQELRFNKKYQGSSQQAILAYDSLVKQFGPPKSVRGDSYVWDIENPDKSATQSDLVTVILKMGNSGNYEVLIDRDRGGNGKATWAATHALKSKLKLQNLKPKSPKNQITLQDDND